jgi:hypothetical protein
LNDYNSVDRGDLGFFEILAKVLWNVVARHSLKHVEAMVDFFDCKRMPSEMLLEVQLKKELKKNLQLFVLSSKAIRLIVNESKMNCASSIEKSYGASLIPRKAVNF